MGKKRSSLNLGVGARRNFTYRLWEAICDQDLNWTLTLGARASRRIMINEATLDS